MKKDDGLHNDCDRKNTLPGHLGAFIFSNSKRFINKFTREIIGFHNKNIYYSDTNSLYVEEKYWYVLEKAKLVGKELCQEGKKG